MPYTLLINKEKLRNFLYDNKSILINGILLNIKLVIKLIINTIREIKKTFIVKFIFKLNILYFINNPKTKP